MNYREFKMSLFDCVQKNIGEGTRVTIESIPKNNGVLLEGMIFYDEEKNVTPIIYVEEFYEYWKKGIPMSQLVNKIIETCQECATQISVEDDFFMDYEEMKSHIYFKLINYEKNKELLQKIPHRRFLDLAMVFYYRMDKVEPMATILIQNSHLQMWEISVEELQRNAYKYTCLYLPAFFMTMAQATQMEDEYEVDTDIPMYVLTNKEKQFGAGAILYPGVLAQAEVLLGDSFYILPSSVHECILISAETTYNQKELAMMVEEINENHVDERDILSNRAYYYSKHSGRIEL